MRTVVRIVPILVVIALVGVGVWWWTSQQQAQATSEIQASGMIEAREVDVGPQVGGRVVQVMAQEGQAVKAGDILFRLDDAQLKSQRAQAEAAINTARAQRDQLLAGARPEQLAAAQATITTTRAMLNGAQANLDQLLAGSTNVEIQAARAQLAGAQAQAKLAQDAYDAVLHGRTNAPQFDVMGTGLGAPEEEMRKQLTAVNSQVTAAQAKLHTLLSGATSDEVRSAQARVDSARAQLKAAQAQYALLLAGPSREQTAAADAAVAQAEAALPALDVLAEKLVVRAPQDGVILTRNVQVGQVLSPGATVFVIGKLDTLQLIVYLPEDMYGRIKLGQTAQVSVDSYPGLTFTALVTHIADQAEYTPRNTQTVEGRRTTVYAIKLDVPNPGGKLKPGMPADVVFAQNPGA
jgi:HlyD family secretion protein